MLERHARRLRLARELAERVSMVRGDLSDAEFTQLVADMVGTAQRFARIDASHGEFHRESWPLLEDDRLPDELQLT